MKITKEAFPQKIECEKNKAFVPVIADKVLANFKHGDNVLFNRASKVLSNSFDGRRLSVECETCGYTNKRVQTHETKLNQFTKTSEKSTINIDINIWSDSIFRVTFANGKPQYKIHNLPDDARMLNGKEDHKVFVDYSENDEYIQLKTNDITLKINKANFCIKAYDSELNLFWQQQRTDIFTSDIFDMSYSVTNGKSACFESFTMFNQEEVFGLGERFDHINRKGKAVDFWNKDAIGTSNTRTYINVPFLFSTNGYGLFLNSSSDIEWEIGTLEASTLGFSIENNEMDYFIIHGPKPADILYKYSTLTGFSPTPPIWSFGLWMSRNSYTSWDVVYEIANKLRKNNIPTDVLHLDTAWFKEDWNCDLEFSKERFANPKENIDKLLELGFKISLWQFNFIPPRENNEHYKEALELGYLVMGDDGKPYAHSKDAIGNWLDHATIDFSNEDAREWYKKKIKKLIKLGAGTIKTDFGEGVPEDGIYKNIEGKDFHNLYSLVYNSVVFNAIKEVSGENIVWARSGTAGSQRYPLHWGGDSQCSYAGLAGTLKAAISMGLTAFPFFSHDIGGFIGRPDPELYIRWAQFGLFSSHSRCHGAGDTNSREPWAFGEEAENIFRKYTNLRYSLLPYIYDQAKKCSKSAKPMVRALLIDYPDDRNTWHIEDEYLFGDSLLIAPILTAMSVSKKRNIYLPKGTWFNYWTKEKIESFGQWITEDVDIEIMPIFVKSGTTLNYCEVTQSTNNKIGKIIKSEDY